MKNLTVETIMLHLLLYKSYFYFVCLPVSVFWVLFFKKKLYLSQTYYLGNQEIDILCFNNKFLHWLNLPLYLFEKKLFLFGHYLSDQRYCSDVDLLVPGIISEHKLDLLAGKTIIDVNESNNKYQENVCVKYKILLLKKYLFLRFFQKKPCQYKNEVRILGVNMKNWSREVALSKISSNSRKVVHFINAENLNKSVNDIEYKMILNKNDFNLIDGVGVSLACRMTKQNIRQNLNGTDLFPYILRQAEREKISVYFIGSTHENVEKMSAKLAIKYPRLNIIGFQTGYLSELDSLSLVEVLKSKRVGYVFVGMGTPIQEKWISKYMSCLDAKCIFAVGGLFDFYSGDKKRAPLFVRRLRAEWVYRLYLEPKRLFRRYILGNPLFLIRVILSKFGLS